MPNVEQQLADIRREMADRDRRIAELERSVGRSGLASIGHVQTHGLPDHLEQTIAPGLFAKVGIRVVSAGGWAALGIYPTTVTAGTIYCQPLFYQRRTTFTGFGVNVQTAAAAGTLGRAAIYTWTAGAMGTLIVDGGTFTTDSTGNKVLTASFSLHGWAVGCVVCDAAPQLGGIDSAQPFHAPIGGRINAYSTNVIGLIGTVTGKSAYVASGFPVAGDAFGSFTTAEYAFIKLTE